jgi:hypothetical protein
MLTVLLLVIILGATIKHYNITWLHQSGAALLLGVLVGAVVSTVRRDPMYRDNARDAQVGAGGPGGPGGAGGTGGTGGAGGMRRAGGAGGMGSWGLRVLG